MPPILIIDSVPIIRLGLQRLLSEKIPGFALMEAGTAEEGLKHLARTRFGLVITDLVLADRQGLGWISDLHKVCPETPIVVFTLQAEDQYAVGSLRAGAHGYVSKMGSLHEIVQAASKSLAGDSYLSPTVSEKIALQKVLTTRSPLSFREYEIFCGIAEGRRLTQIARELNLSVKTISAHKRRIMAKLGARNDAELIRYALENRFMP